ncbi:lipopolysaccharide biosynthesis protein [Lacticaseibacillus baoqingensis]|nr:oligosaccharide flippase family protein [Lacticaseibacillus baoqingensis]
MVNSSVSAIIYLLRTLLGFVSRSFFIHYLGVNFLGLNGLFTNVLSFLSLAELGIGFTIVYELYSPLATGDTETTKSLMLVYRKAYTIIGIVVGVAGICLVPFLSLIIHGTSGISNVYQYYLLFLSNSVVSYFFTYKRSLLNADQKNYITVVNDFVFYSASVVLQILFLVLYQDYSIFLIIQVLTTLASNIYISSVVNKQYPYIREKNVKPLSKAVSTELKKNILGNMSTQIGSIIVLGSDNILLSAFVGLSAVGIYSNYTLITNAVKSIVQQATSSIISSVGNLVAKKDNLKIFSVFQEYWFINSSASFLTSTITFALINGFISVWIGPKYLLPRKTVCLIATYLIVLMYQGSTRTFISAYGLFWQQRWKPIFEAGTNLGFSLFFLQVFHLGLDGVLLGTICSSIFVNAWYEPYIAFKFGFHQSLYMYFLRTLLFYMKYSVAIAVLWIVQLHLFVDSLMSFVRFTFVSVILVGVLYLLLFSWEKEFRSAFNRFKRMI